MMARDPLPREADDPPEQAIAGAGLVRLPQRDAEPGPYLVDRRFGRA
jgi:hypothetical protein